MNASVSIQYDSSSWFDSDVLKDVFRDRINPIQGDKIGEPLLNWDSLAPSSTTGARLSTTRQFFGNQSRHKLGADIRREVQTGFVAQLANFEWIKTKRKNRSNLERRIKNKVNYRAGQRYKEFANYYDGWCGADSKEMSRESAALLSAFLREVYFFPTVPSIFLRPEGHLELAWDDFEGNEVHITFGQNLIYLESASFEGEIRATSSAVFSMVAITLGLGSNK